MENSQIILVYEEDIDKKVFDTFIDAVSYKKLSIKTVPTDKGGLFAGMEWLMPTAIFAYISKSYFDSFLKEMGKDHYQLLKKGFNSLWKKLVGSEAPQLVLVTGNSSPNKIIKNNPYSLYFSITAEARNNMQFKLLIHQNCTFEIYQRTVDSFLDFLEQYHNNKLEKSFIEKIHQNSISRTILVSYDIERNILKFITLEDIKNKKSNNTLDNE
jgi:hypothetical protein